MMDERFPKAKSMLMQANKMVLENQIHFEYFFYYFYFYFYRAKDSDKNLFNKMRVF